MPLSHFTTTCILHLRSKVEVAMVILGHKNATMLLEVYASAVSEELRQAAVILQHYVTGTSG